MTGWGPPEWEAGDEIVLGPEDLDLTLLERNTDNFRFLTFRNYFGAAALVVTETYGDVPYAAIAASTRALPGVARIQRRTMTDIDRRRTARELRAAWTFESSLGRLAELATEDAPEVVMIENQSLATSAHYCLYRGARALALALHAPMPERHEHYLDFTENQLVRRGLVPVPWSCAAAKGSAPRSPSRRLPDFLGFPVAVSPCDHQTRPDAETMWPLLATALKTTRDKQSRFESEVDGWRQRNPPKRRRIPRTARRRPVPFEVQDGIYAAMRPVTVLDLIYRVRCRQHYKDDSSFLSADISLRDALGFNRDLALLTRASLHVIEALIEAAAGTAFVLNTQTEFAAGVRASVVAASWGRRHTSLAGARAG